MGVRPQGPHSRPYKGAHEHSMYRGGWHKTLSGEPCKQRADASFNRHQRPNDFKTTPQRKTPQTESQRPRWEAQRGGIASTFPGIERTEAVSVREKRRHVHHPTQGIRIRAGSAPPAPVHPCPE
eukprot:gene24878-biopygen5969